MVCVVLAPPTFDNWRPTALFYLCEQWLQPLRQEAAFVHTQPRSVMLTLQKLLLHIFGALPPQKITSDI